MKYEFSGLKTDGQKTMVLFNRAGAELEVEASDFAFSQFRQTMEISPRARLDAAAAIIGANVDIVPSFKK